MVLDPTQSIGATYASGGHTFTFEGPDTIDVAPGIQDECYVFGIDQTATQVIWSKNYGIVQMPVWKVDRINLWHNVYEKGQLMRLQILEGVFGLALPSPANIFDYQVGDWFTQVETNYATTNTWFHPVHQTYVTYTVRSRTSNPVSGIRIFELDSSTVVKYSRDPNGLPDTTLYFPDHVTTWRIKLKESFLTGFQDTMGSLNMAIVYDTLGGDTILQVLRKPFSGPDDRGCYEERDLTFVENYYTKLGFYSGRYEFDNGRMRDRQLVCYSTGGVFQACPAGITAIPKVGEVVFKLKENPILTSIEILSPTPLQLTLQDMQGRTVASGDHTTSLPVPTLPPGLYILKVTDAQGRTGLLRVVKN